MKQPMMHPHPEHRHAPGLHWPASHLAGQRARLRVLIYTMEHDVTVQAQPWQIESLKRMLGDIEQRMQHPTVH
jgi:hypothetical protein